LACKLHHLVVHAWPWLSSWSCAHVIVRCGVVLLCRSWWHCRHGGGSLAVLCDVVSVVAFVIASCSHRGIIQELVATPRSSIAKLACGVGGHNPELQGLGSHRFGWPLSHGLRRGSHPVVGRIVYMSCWTIFGRRVVVLAVLAVVNIHHKPSTYLA
jgi:hypothetical protein